MNRYFNLRHYGEETKDQLCLRILQLALVV